MNSKLNLALSIVLLSYNTMAQSISTVNTSKYRYDGNYDWTFYLEAENSILDQIVSVEYTLHPSFKLPYQKVTNPTLSSYSF